MAYQNIGFDEFLTRVEASPQQSQQLDPLEFDTFTDQLSGSKIQGGVMTSPSGRIKLDLENETFVVNNGVEDLINFGVLPDGSIGLIIRDSQGRILMKVSEGEFYLESPLKTSRMDLISDQYTIRDEQQRLKVLIGKDEGGF